MSITVYIIEWTQNTAHFIASMSEQPCAPFSHVVCVVPTALAHTCCATTDNFASAFASFRLSIAPDDTPIVLEILRIADEVREEIPMATIAASVSAAPYTRQLTKSEPYGSHASTIDVSRDSCASTTDVSHASTIDVLCDSPIVIPKRCESVPQQSPDIYRAGALSASEVESLRTSMMESSASFTSRVIYHTMWTQSITKFCILYDVDHGMFQAWYRGNAPFTEDLHKAFKYWKNDRKRGIVREIPVLAGRLRAALSRCANGLLLSEKIEAFRAEVRIGRRAYYGWSRGDIMSPGISAKVRNWLDAKHT